MSVWAWGVIGAVVLVIAYTAVALIVNGKDAFDVDIGD